MHKLRTSDDGSPVVYAIFCHKAPQQVVRLVNRLDHPLTRFVIHVDSRAPDRMVEEIESGCRSRVRIVERFACPWGGYGFVHAQLKTVEAALAIYPNCSHVGLISGQDYPLVPACDIVEFLHQRKSTTFLRHNRLPNPNWPRQGGLERVRYRHLGVRGRKVAFIKPGQFGNPLVKPVWDFAARVRPIATRQIRGFEEIYGGSAVSFLSRDAALYLTTAVGGNRRLRWQFRTVKNPDEILFHTVLLNAPESARAVIENKELHYIDWSEGFVHPKTLGLDDLSMLRESGRFFARKFDPEHPRVLDAIDRWIDS